MSTVAKREEGVFHLQPAGTQQGVCYAVHDLGYQSGEWKGVKNVQAKLIFSFELTKRISSEDAYSGKRYTIHFWITNSLGKKANLPKVLESWLGRPLTKQELKNGFDTVQMVGKNCFLNIVHEGLPDNPKAKIKGIMALPDGMSLIQAENKSDTPEWVKKIQDQQVSEDEAQAIREAAHHEEAEVETGE